MGKDIDEKTKLIGHLHNSSLDETQFSGGYEGCKRKNREKADLEKIGSGCRERYVRTGREKTVVLSLNFFLCLLAFSYVIRSLPKR